MQCPVDFGCAHHFLRGAVRRRVFLGQQPDLYRQAGHHDGYCRTGRLVFDDYRQPGLLHRPGLCLHRDAGRLPLLRRGAHLDSDGRGRAGSGNYFLPDLLDLHPL